MRDPDIEEILLFQEILYKVKIDLDQSQMLKEIDKLKKEDPKGVSYSNEGLGWQSDPNKTLQNDYFSFINETTGNIVSNIFNNQFITTRIHINISPKYSYNTYHGHGESDLVGVIYIKTPENCGNLVLWDPLQKYVSKDVTPQCNYLYIFSPYLFHEVRMNMNDEERISLAFNFNKVKNYENK